MKIAIAYDQGNVFQHFGHTKQFKLYTVDNNKIIDAALLETNGSGHGALANLLSLAKAFKPEPDFVGRIFCLALLKYS